MTRPRDSTTTPSPTEPDPAPVNVGDRLALTIDRLAFGGDGVARWGDFVVFVPFTAPGEEVEAEIVEVKRRYARAIPRNILQASPHRVTPPCPYFQQCGGCQYQHLDYPTQLEAKHRQITELFHRIGRFQDVTVEPLIPCPRPFGYRNRIMVRTQWNGREQRLVLGFLQHDNRWVVDIEQCPIAEPELNTQLLKARRSPPPKGGLKVSLRSFPEGWIVPRDSFFQNNFHLLPELVGVVQRLLHSGGSRHLIDAYCGVGFFALELAQSLDSFVGIELDAQAILAARENAGRRQRQNGKFILADVQQALPAVLKELPPDSSALLLDPPRRGCPRETIEFLRDQPLPQIIYVSCHPATLARDLQLLTETGRFALSRVVPLDMFPQTQHVELVADLRLQPCQATRL